MSPNDHPIGHGHAAPNAAKEDSCVLDHESAAEHLASIAKDSAELRTSEEFKGLLVRASALDYHEPRGVTPSLMSRLNVSVAAIRALVFAALRSERL